MAPTGSREMLSLGEREKKQQQQNVFAVKISVLD